MPLTLSSSIFAGIALTAVLADGRPPSIFAPVVSTAVLADGRAPAFFAVTALAAMVAIWAPQTTPSHEEAAAGVAIEPGLCQKDDDYSFDSFVQDVIPPGQQASSTIGERA